MISPHDLAHPFQIHIVYVNTENTLSYQIFDILRSSWFNKSRYYYQDISNYITDPNTRALSLTLRRNETLYAQENATLTRALSQPNAQDSDVPNFFKFQCYLLYENTSGQMVVLLGSFNYTKDAPQITPGLNQTVGASWIWQDANLPYQLASFREEIWGSGPFSSSIAPPMDQSSSTFDLTITALLFPDTSVSVYPTVYVGLAWNDSTIFPGEFSCCFSVIAKAIASSKYL